jgi:hypothetical protein
MAKANAVSKHRVGSMPNCQIPIPHSPFPTPDSLLSTPYTL